MGAQPGPGSHVLSPLGSAASGHSWGCRGEHGGEHAWETPLEQSWWGLFGSWCWGSASVGLQWEKLSGFWGATGQRLPRP